MKGLVVAPQAIKHGSDIPWVQVENVEYKTWEAYCNDCVGDYVSRDPYHVTVIARAPP